MSKSALASEEMVKGMKVSFIIKLTRARIANDVII